MLKKLIGSTLPLSAVVLSGVSFAGPIGLGKTDLASPDVYTMPSVNTETLRIQANARQAQETSGSPIPFEISSALQTDISQLAWEQINNEQTGGTNMAVARFQVNSAGATNLNLGFTEFFIPEGGSLYIYSADGNEVLGPYGAEQNESHGQLWTPLLVGDTAIIELSVPADQVDAVRLRLTQVNHGFRGDKPTSNLKNLLESGSCNVDTACSAGDNWRDQIDSVAHYSFSTGSGSFVCTGAAINNTAQDNRRLFLTADHCLDEASYAPTVVAYWKFESPNCREPGSSSSGGNGFGPRNINQTGAVMLVQNPDSDFALIELDDPIPEAANVYFAGWDRSSNTPTQATSIHHPRGDEKRISHDFDRLTALSTHWRVEDWDVGTTEGGSSGSPLFDVNKRIIGQLTGGAAACGNDEYDIYGRMDVNWRLGIGEYLDPLNTGAMTLDGRLASGTSPSTPPPTPTPTATPTPTQPPTPDTPPPTPAPGDGALIEAEAASLQGDAQVFDDGAASGGQSVGWIYTQDSGFTVTSAESTSGFTLRYASESQGTISVRVNGSDAGNIRFSSTGAWTGTYSEVSFNTDISAGDSVQVFFDEGDTAMNVDYIEFFSGDPSPTPTIVPCESNQKCTGTPTPTPTPTPVPGDPTPLPTVPSVDQMYQFIVHKGTGAKIQTCGTDAGDIVASVPNSASWQCVQWQIIGVDNHHFLLENRHSALNLFPNKDVDGSWLSLQPWTGDWAQWLYIDTGDGYGHIQNKATGKHIFLPGTGEEIESRPTSWTGDYTRWQFVDAQ